MRTMLSNLPPKSNFDGWLRQRSSGKEFRLDPNDVLNTIRFRRSIRNFKETAISQNIIERILEAGRLTHTAKNMQDVSFVVLDKEKKRIEKMAVKVFRAVKPIADLFSPLARNNKINDSFFFFNTPLVIVILHNARIYHTVLVKHIWLALCSRVTRNF